MKIDPHSETWQAVKAWAAEREREHLIGLREVGTSKKDTEGRRYALIELESLVKFGEPTKMAADGSSR